MHPPIERVHLFNADLNAPSTYRGNHHLQLFLRNFDNSRGNKYDHFGSLFVHFGASKKEAKNRQPAKIRNTVIIFLLVSS